MMVSNDIGAGWIVAQFFDIQYNTIYKKYLTARKTPFLDGIGLFSYKNKNYNLYIQDRFYPDVECMMKKIGKNIYLTDIKALTGFCVGALLYCIISKCFST